jgi:hypothetical protein
MLWRSPSSFDHVTVPPGATVTVAGPKAKSAIWTVALAGAAAASGSAVAPGVGLADEPGVAEGDGSSVGSDEAPAAVWSATVWMSGYDHPSSAVAAPHAPTMSAAAVMRRAAGRCRTVSVL